jgi:hypothetical protein
LKRGTVIPGSLYPTQVTGKLGRGRAFPLPANEQSRHSFGCFSRGWNIRGGAPHPPHARLTGRICAPSSVGKIFSPLQPQAQRPPTISPQNSLTASAKVILKRRARPGMWRHRGRAAPRFHFFTCSRVMPKSSAIDVSVAPAARRSSRNAVGEF